MQEAGRPEPAAALRGTTTADVVVVGGGYLGLWTAWHVLRHDPGARVVVLEADTCGTGPWGRNGGFVNGLWDKAPTVRGQAGRAAAVELLEAAQASVDAIGAWCEEQRVDAWFRRAAHLEVATRRPRRAGTTRSSPPARRSATPTRCARLTPPRSRRCATPPSSAAGCARVGRDGPAGAAGVRAARPRLRGGRRPSTRAARPPRRRRAGAAGADGRRRGARRRGRPGRQPRQRRAGAAAARADRRVEPHRADRAGPRRPRAGRLDRRRGDERPADDAALLPHHPGRSHRLRLGRRAHGAGRAPARRPRRRPRRAVAHRSATSCGCFPELAGRASPTPGAGRSTSPPRTCRSSGRCGAAGSTPGSASPATASGRPTSAGGSSPRWRSTAASPSRGCASSEPDAQRFPPEPLRLAGGAAIRAAMVHADDLLDDGRTPDPLTRFVTSLPRRLGMSLPR